MPGTLKAMPIVLPSKSLTRPHVGQITSYSPAIRFPVISKFVEGRAGISGRVGITCNGPDVLKNNRELQAELRVIDPLDLSS